MFIGENKIKDSKEVDGVVTVSFKHDHPTVELQKNLFDMIVSEKKDRGTITDKINFVVATKFILELSDYGLEFNAVDNISASMQTLAHNLRENLFTKSFKGSGGSLGIKLSELLDEDYVEEETK